MLFVTRTTQKGTCWRCLAGSSQLQLQKQCMYECDQGRCSRLKQGMPFELVDQLQAIVVDVDEALASFGAVGLQRRQQALHAGGHRRFQALLQCGWFKFQVIV